MADSRAFLYNLLVHGRLRTVAAPIYDLVVAQELALQRRLDTILPNSGSRNSPRLADLTAVIKTFERPRSVVRLIGSIKRLYPSLKVVVVDDSRKTLLVPGVETAAMPFDSGVSAGRREGLRRVRTKYTLILDDDYVLYRGTRLEEALRLLERFSQIDIMGGTVVHLPFFHVTDGRFAAPLPTDSPPTMPPHSRIGALLVLDKVPNFFIARTERLRLVDWNPALKRVEHADFFSRCKGTLTSVSNPRLRCLHAQSPFHPRYMAARTDTLLDSAILHYRWRRSGDTAAQERERRREAYDK